MRVHKVIILKENVRPYTFAVKLLEQRLLISLFRCTSFYCFTCTNFMLRFILSTHFTYCTYHICTAQFKVGEYKTNHLSIFPLLSNSIQNFKYCANNSWSLQSWT